MNMLQSLYQAGRESWRSTRQEHLLKRATVSTYRQWSQRHPEWVVGLFDEHFVTYHVTPLLRQSLRKQTAVDPLCLVDVWAAQFHLSPAQRRLRTDALLPAVVDFLRRLKVELVSQEVNSPERLATWLDWEECIVGAPCNPGC